MAEIFGHHQFAGQLGGRHASQRFTDFCDVPRVATRVCDHVDFRPIERAGDEVEAVVCVGGGRGIDHAPRTQSHCRGANAEHRPRSLAKNERSDIGDAQIVLCEQRVYAFENTGAGLGVAETPLRRSEFALRPEAGLHARRCGIDQQQSGVLGKQLAETGHQGLHQAPPRHGFQACRIGH